MYAVERQIASIYSPKELKLRVPARGRLLPTPLRRRIPIRLLFPLPTAHIYESHELASLHSSRNFLSNCSSTGNIGCRELFADESVLCGVYPVEVFEPLVGFEVVEAAASAHGGVLVEELLD